MLVWEVLPLTDMVPSGVSSSFWCTRCVLGLFPIAMNSPWMGISVSVPLMVSVSLIPSTRFSPVMFVTCLFQMKSILGFVSALCCIILEARSLFPRCMMWTLSANRVKNSASSIAESPPPTTAISLFLKNAPSQVAHQETPYPESLVSAASPSLR